MKKSILNIAILFTIFSVVLSSCSKDDIETPADQAEGKYTVIIDGKTVASGTTIEVGYLEALATIGEGDDFGLLVGSVPLTVGGVTQFDATNASGTITIMGKNLLLTDGSDELYFSKSGTIKRESTTKISFQGTCTAMLSSVSHTFSGTIESDAYKLIK